MELASFILSDFSKGSQCVLVQINVRVTDVIREQIIWHFQTTMEVATIKLVVATIELVGATIKLVVT